MGHVLRLSGTFLYDSTSPFPDVPIAIEREWRVDSGSTSGKANKVFVQDITLAASATQDMNLAQLYGPSGEFAPEYLVSFVIWSVTAGGKGTLTPHATNGWTGFGSAYSVPVSTAPLSIGSDDGIAISSTNKVLTLTNTSSASATFRVTLLLRDT